MDFYQKILDNKNYTTIYCCVMILLCVIITYYIFKNENFVRSNAYSSGATQRFKQELSATNQRMPETIYNMDELKQLKPGRPYNKLDEIIKEENVPTLGNQEEHLMSQLQSENYVSPGRQVGIDLD